jgi:SIR2-like domain
VAFTDEVVEEREAAFQESPRGVPVAILKIHGCIDEPGKMIFSRQDYAAARNRYANFYSILDALAITHTFIFLGCGVNDPDVRLILENYAFRFKESLSHFIVMSQRHLHEDEKAVIQSSMNLKVLTYDAKNNHIELGRSIAELTSLVDTERQQLAASLGW